jgi:hypothetical protein
MKSLRLKVPLLVAAILLFAASAFAQDVSFNFDMTADFTKYKTYHWEKHPNSKDLDDLTMTQLGAALDAELAKKGLTKKTDGNSDLAIVYQVAVKQEKELSTFSSGYSTGPGWGGGYGGFYGGTSTSTTSVYTITKGTLALDMYDASSKKLVWRGIATKTLDVDAKPEKRQKNMAKGSEKLLKKYPPVVKTKK